MVAVRSSSGATMKSCSGGGGDGGGGEGGIEGGGDGGKHVIGIRLQSSAGLAVWAWVLELAPYSLFHSALWLDQLWCVSALLQSSMALAK